MIHISLFSGIGGFELAAEWMGWRNLVSCDINEFGNKVREYYWPDGYCHRDVKTLTYETIDRELSARFGPEWRDDDIILTGGFPCQPYSAAGKRLGKEDERHLWPDMCRVISEVKPTYIVGENVRGLTNWNGGVVFEEVCADLEAIGYEVQPILLPACAVNAPHRRDRVWFVAYNHSFIRRKRGEFEPREQPRYGESNESCYTKIDGPTPDAKNIGSSFSKLGKSQSKQQIQTGSNLDRHEELGSTPDTDSDGFNQGRRHESSSKNDNGSNTQIKRSTTAKDIDRCGTYGDIERECGINTPFSDNTDDEKNKTSISEGVCSMDTTNNTQGTCGKDQSSIYESGTLVSDKKTWFFSSDNRGLEYDKESFDRLGEVGISNDTSREYGMEGDASDTSKIGLSTEMENRELVRNKRFEFSNKRNTWDTFPTQSPICGRDDGLPTRLDNITFSKWRNESIKAYGNAIVPQVAYQIFKAITVRTL